MRSSCHATQCAGAWLRGLSHVSAWPWGCLPLWRPPGRYCRRRGGHWRYRYAHRHPAGILPAGHPLHLAHSSFCLRLLRVWSLSRSPRRRMARRHPSHWRSGVRVSLPARVGCWDTCYGVRQAAHLQTWQPRDGQNDLQRPVPRAGPSHQVRNAHIRALPLLRAVPKPQPQGTVEVKQTFLLQIWRQTWRPFRWQPWCVSSYIVLRPKRQRRIGGAAWHLHLGRREHRGTGGPGSSPRLLLWPDSPAAARRPQDAPAGPIAPCQYNPTPRATSRTHSPFFFARPR